MGFKESPCAACKILRRRCVQDCVLAPYFPPTDPVKFITAHRVFGASNIAKFLQEVPEAQRADAVSSMVYEAQARLRDPVYGCVGAIAHLQQQVNLLQEQLAKAHAQLVAMQSQNDGLMGFIYMSKEMAPSLSLHTPPPHRDYDQTDSQVDWRLHQTDSAPNFRDECEFYDNDADCMWMESIWEL